MGDDVGNVDFYTKPYAIQVCKELMIENDNLKSQFANLKSQKAILTDRLRYARGKSDEMHFAKSYEKTIGMR